MPTDDEDLGYEVKYESFAYNGVDFRIRSLLDRSQYADPDGEAEALGIPDGFWPISGLIWPSGHILAAQMSTFDIRGRRVLEVGCGIALATLVCAERGADVTATDYHPLVETLLRANAGLNDLRPIAYQHGNWHTANPELGRFDLIVGSDLLYDDAHPEALAGFIERHAVEGAEVMLVDPGRGSRGRFVRAMSDLGFEGDQALAPATVIDGKAYQGRLLTFTQ